MTIELDPAALAFQLRREVRGEVRFDPASRALYAADASAYRHEPIGVVSPRDPDDVAATVAVCREAGAPVTMRGAGTSLAGQAINETVVLDLSRHLRHRIDVDPHARVATVEPGVVLDDLQRAAAPHGLRFGPDPATANRCTVGGMVGNDSCGVHSVVAGRTQDNVVSLDVLLYDGTRFTARACDPAAVRPRSVEADVLHALAALRGEHATTIRARFPRLPRRVSGYNLDALLPEHGFDVARALVGTEGTCAIVLGATLRLIDLPSHHAVAILGYPSLAVAAEDIGTILATGPTGLEGIDAEVAAGVRRTSRRRDLDLLPTGSAWLLVEYGGRSPAECDARIDALRSRLRSTSRPPSLTAVTDPAAVDAVWEIRRAGLGATAFPAPGRRRHPGWEDAAVPPEVLPHYLRSLDALLREHGREAAVYGHLGDGCVHAKIDFDHTTAPGRARYRRFVEEAADLTVSLGGSLSGEHGDGQARSELLVRMFGAEVVALFERYRTIWDPDGMLNPGVIVAPRRLDDDLRGAELPTFARPRTAFTFAADGGSMAAAADRCVGVGLCRRDDDVATMCPSFRATREEEHSPRGRAHLLYELLRPGSELDGFDDRSVRRALDLCLSCKACKAECPTGVDIATYKAEFLHQHHRRRLRPRAAYATGLVPWWARVGSRAPRLANAVLGSRIARRLAGIATDRPAPALAPETFRTWWTRRGGTRDRPTAERVVLFPDTFTDRFEPWIGSAAVAVLEDAGLRVDVPGPWLCCGRPLYDHGMLTLARRQLERLVAVLGEGTAPVVVLEPSCLATFRDELPGLLGTDAAHSLAARAVSLAELLTTNGYAPAAAAAELAFQPHCQAAAVVGTGPDLALLRRVGEVTALDAGCCGMAGSFGLTAGSRHDVSLAIAHDRYVPALAAVADGTPLVADGFSCRAQTAGLTGRRAHHLAEVLAAGLHGPAR